MDLKNSLRLLLVLSNGILIFAVKSKFLDAVKNSALLHHKQTNTIWEYLGTYGQTENTVNFILEVPVFQFMCDILPISMAFAMQACMQYRARVLENNSARRLNELVEDHVGKQKKRQIAELAIAGTAAYGAYKIIGDFFRGSNDEIIHRLDESENFQKHQEKLNNVLTTSILSLEDDNLVLLKSFKSLYDSVNTTRSLIHGLLKMSLKQQRTFTGWAKFSLKSELRRHYEQMVSAFSRVANHDLNLDMFSPEQRTFIHDFLWNRIRSNLPSNFSASLAQFVPNLLVQQIVSFSSVNESEIIYELKEDDFHFVIETDADDKFARNETIDLDSILPLIIGHARIECFFGIPANFSHKKMDLYKITRLPLFVNKSKVVYTVDLPRYLALGEDGSSSEWSDNMERKCTVDKTSRSIFCSIPLPIFRSIQHPCLRSIILDNSAKNCLKQTVDLSAPHIVKFAPNIHAISVHTSLQCFEKGDKERENVFSNITKIAIIKTHCNSFVSCGTFDFSSLGGVCDKVESYIFTFNDTNENLFKLDKSVNPVDTYMNDLNSIMDIPSLIESALSHQKHLKDAHMEFQSNIHHVIKTKSWAKLAIGIFVLISILTIVKIISISKNCLKKCNYLFNWKRKFDYFLRLCINAKQTSINDSSLNVQMNNSMPPQNAICYDILLYDEKSTDQFQPLSDEIMVNNLTEQNSIKKKSVLNSNTTHNSLSFTTHCNSGLPSSSSVLSPKMIHKKPNPMRRKIYDYLPELSDIPSDVSTITSKTFSGTNRESEY